MSNDRDDLLQSMLRQITENTRVQQETAVLVKGLAVRVDSLEESRKRDEDRRDRRQENAPEGVRGWMIVSISVVAAAIAACSLLGTAVTVLPHLALH